MNPENLLSDRNLVSFSISTSPDENQKPTGKVPQWAIDKLDVNPASKSTAKWIGRSIKYATIYYGAYLAGKSIGIRIFGDYGYCVGILAAGGVKISLDYAKYKLDTEPAIKAIKEVNNYQDQLEHQKIRQTATSKSKGMEYFDRLPGLHNIKEQITQIALKVKIDHEREVQGLKSHKNSYHMCFIGRPGTGKTESAKAMAEILYDLGVTRENKCTIADKSSFNSYFAGDTASKTEKVFNRASGGVLFIDEAYTLNGTQTTTNGERVGSDAIEKILTLLEDRKNDVVAIFAGYPEEMNKFKSMNPGLASRIPLTVKFDNYTDNELADIFKFYCSENDYIISDSICDAAKKQITAMKAQHGESFANARTVRNFFEKVLFAQSKRLCTTDSTTARSVSTNSETDTPGIPAASEAEIPASTRHSMEEAGTSPNMSRNLSKDKLMEILLCDIEAVSLDELNPHAIDDNMYMTIYS